MKKLLLTGASGFIGTHLRAALERSNKFQIFAPSPAELDLSRADRALPLIREHRWDVVIHLAAMSHVVECENNPDQARAINVKGTETLVEALGDLNSTCHLLFASTAQVYQAPQGPEIARGVVFEESRAVVPQNFYAQTKLLAEDAVKSAADRGLRATILRLFNHTHKTQAPTFFMPHIYKQLLSGTSPIPVGNLDLDRDIGSVRDLTRAWTMILERADWNFETFNICTGTPKRLRRLAELLRTRLRISAEFVEDPSRRRLGEPVQLLGSHQKLTERIGWQPEVLTEEDLIEDFLCD